jgi:hypothetical protein
MCSYTIEGTKKNAFLPQLSKGTKNALLKSKEQKKSNVFTPQLSKELRKSNVITPQLLKERKKIE